MPSKALKFCAWPGCNQLTHGRYCDIHASEKAHMRVQMKAQHSKNRESAAKRGYDAKWRKVRKAKLAPNPLCEECKRQGRVVVAVLVDHIVPIMDGGDRLDFKNLQSLCRDCHDKKTLEDLKKRKSRAGREV